MPTAAAREKSAENSQTGAGDDEEGQIKARLFFMSPRGPSWAPPPTHALTPDGWLLCSEESKRSLHPGNKKKGRSLGANNGKDRPLFLGE